MSEVAQGQLNVIKKQYSTVRAADLSNSSHILATKSQPERVWDQFELARRTSLLMPTINRLFPLAENPSSYRIRMPDISDQEWQQMQQPDYQQRQLASIIADTRIPIEQLQDYTAALAVFAKSVKARDFSNNIQEATKWASRSESFERLQMWQSFYTQWESAFFSKVSNIQDEKNIFDHVADRFCEKGKAQKTQPPNLSIEEMATFIPIAIALRERKLARVDSYAVFLYGEDSALTLGIELHDAEQTARMLQAVQDTLHDDKRLTNEYLDIVYNYSAYNGGLSADVARGFIENILPRMRRNDPITAVFYIDAGDRVNLDGLPRLVVKAFTERVTPANINELLLLSKHIAGKTALAFDQNRWDGMDLTKTFNGLQGVIHDNGWKGHKLVNMMIHYYDTYNNEDNSQPPELRLLLSKLFSEAPAEHKETIIESYTDHKKYEREIITRRVLPDGKAVKEKKVVIDVLRRLEKNTKPVDEDPPLTLDIHLDEQLLHVQQTKNKREQQRQTLGEALAYVNIMLIQQMRENTLGIEQNTILAIAWLDRQGFSALQQMSFEEQYPLTVYKETWFQELLRFEELTTSAYPFDEQDFTRYIAALSQASAQEAYKLIAERTAKNVKPLLAKYQQQGKEDWIESLRGETVRELTEVLPFYDKEPVSLWGELAASTKEAQDLKKERQTELSYIRQEIKRLQK